MIVTVDFLGLGREKLKRGEYTYKVVSSSDTKGEIRNHVTDKRLFSYVWNKRSYDYPLLFSPKLKKPISMRDPDLGVHTKATLHIARLILETYLELSKQQKSKQMEFDFSDCMFGNEEIKYEPRILGEIPEPSPVHLESIVSVRFAPYPTGSKEKKKCGTPGWFTEVYKILTACYKRIEGGTAHELDVFGNKIFLYNRHTKLTDNPKLQEAAERVVREVLHPWCNKCKNTEGCSKPCIDVNDIVGEMPEGKE